MPHKAKSSAEIVAIRKRLNAIYVGSDRDLIVREAIDSLLDRDEAGNVVASPRRFTGGLECRGLAISDASGSGKTRIIEANLMKNPVLGPCATGVQRFVHVTVPSPATLKNLGCEILRKTGYHDISERRERWSIWNIVRNRLQSLGVVILWIDEAHDMIRTKSEVEDLLKTLKRLMQGDQAVIVMLSGTDRLLDLVYSDDEVQRRFTKIQLPKLFEGTEGDALRDVISQYCAIADLAPPDEPDLVSRLIHARRGRFGACIEMTLDAIELALVNGDDRLALHHFSEGWSRRETLPNEENAFSNAAWASIDLDAYIGRAVRGEE